MQNFIKNNNSINIHATAISINGIGVLLRGETGSGKSLLALELLEMSDSGEKTTQLIADDRVDIFKENSTIIMRPPKIIAGLIELYGHGIISYPYLKQAQLHLIVDLVDKIERLPNKSSFETEFFGIKFAHCSIPNLSKTNPSHQILLIKQAMRSVI